MSTLTPPMSRPGRSRAGLWIALAALAVGVVIAVVGVRAAVASYQRDQAIQNYHDARNAATYYARNGRTISAAMKKLQRLDDRDAVLMEAQHRALDARDSSTYNSLTDSANARTAQQQALHRQVTEFQSAFAAAQHR